ncbi:MAG: S-layer protein sap precursor [Pelotomaculum sp. PtaB.Bin104]|nr:MAG: S-layer protein sap precursor [Pelotomaculum sp. PtaB.Bin104]
MVETNDATELKADAATLNGRMTECFGVIKQYGFFYGTDTRTTKKVVVGTNEYVEKAYKKSISDLLPGKYYYKAFATNAAGTGYGELKEFTIEETLTRAGLAQIVAEKFNLAPILPAEPAFNDVPLEHWAAGYIYAVAGEGLLKGDDEGNFYPDQLVTRAAYAAFLYERFNIPTYNPTPPTFNDVPVDYWAFIEIESLKHAGIMSGTDEGTFSPDGSINKADATTIIQSLPEPVYSDINGDGNINILDLQFVNSNLGPAENGAARKSDVNDDYQVDIIDLLLVAKNIGN